MFLFIATSISNDLTVHFMLYNSINVISKRYAGTDIYFKAASFDMNDIMEGSRATVDEDMEIGDEYPVDIAVMNNLEYKFHPQEPFGRLLQNNEFVMLRSRMPMTEHIVSVLFSLLDLLSFIKLYFYRESELTCSRRLIMKMKDSKRLHLVMSIPWISTKVVDFALCQLLRTLAKLLPK